MKKTLPLIGILSLAVIGCSGGFMYGDHKAPVTNQNSYYGQSAAPVIPAQPSGQTYAETLNQPTQIGGRDGSVRPVPIRPPQVQVNEPSPYQPSPQTAQMTDGDDGWAVRPDQALTDTPKIAENTPGTAQDNDLKPIRPNTSGEETEKSTGAQTQRPNPDPDEKQVAAATPPSRQSTPAEGQSATASLLKQASAALGKGDLDGAVAYLKDAERIEPNNVKIQYDIANIRYHQGRYNEAETAASRAVRTGGSNAMMKKAWSLIANARKALGDNQGAITAAERAASY